MPEPKKTADAASIKMSTRDILKAAAVVMGLYIAMRLVWSVYALLIVAFLGVLFGLAISRAVEPIARIKFRLGAKLQVAVPRGLAAGIVVLGFVGLMAGLIAWSAPTLGEQFGILRQRLPQAIEKVDAFIESKRSGMLGPLISNLSPPVEGTAGDSLLPIAARDTGARAAGQRNEPQMPSDTLIAGEGVMSQLLTRLVVSGQKYLFPFISSAFTIIAGILLVIMLAIYVAADPGLYQRGVMHLVPHANRVRAGAVMSAMATALRRWLHAQFIGMIVIGVVTTIALYMLGIPAALPLGIVAGILEFIPNVGPIIAAAPAVLMGFIDGPEKALWVAVTYMVIQQVEAQLLVPLLMQEGVDLPPVLTILAQALMAIVFGFVGLLVAVPLLAIVVVAIKMLYVEGIVGDIVSEPEDSL